MLIGKESSNNQASYPEDNTTPPTNAPACGAVQPCLRINRVGSWSARLELLPCELDGARPVLTPHNIEESKALYYLGPVPATRSEAAGLENQYAINLTLTHLPDAGSLMPKKTSSPFSSRLAFQTPFSKSPSSAQAN